MSEIVITTPTSSFLLPFAPESTLLTFEFYFVKALGPLISFISQLRLLVLLPFKSFQFIPLDFATDSLWEEIRVNNLDLAGIFIWASVLLAKVLQFLDDRICPLAGFIVVCDNHKCLDNLPAHLIRRGDDCRFNHTRM